MKNILIIGAGQSSGALIDYLLGHSKENDWEITLADLDHSLCTRKINKHARGRAVRLDISNEIDRNKYISETDIVISLMPANLHQLVAISCLRYGKDLVTASYISPEIGQLKDQVKNAGLIFLKECGLDPGIDHMSAMNIINTIRSSGGSLRTFETFTGALLSPRRSTENPWQYKFTWNPRNVVLSGQGGVKFLQEGTYKYIPYHKIFRRIEMLYIPGYGYYEGYANRDSLKYLDLYGLHDIKTLFRGTLRSPGFCHSWDVFVQLGATDDSYQMERVDTMTHRSFINSFLTYNPFDSVELKLAHYLNLEMDSREMINLRWLGIFDSEPVGLDKGTPAQILEHILRKKWTLNTNDRDMVVMWHKFEYSDKDRFYIVNSSLIVEGDDQTHTAISKTVGLPVAIATKLILQQKIKKKGIIIPTIREIYEPVLNELRTFGISVKDEAPREIKIPGRNP